ncbi:hypothetical protein QQ054_24050 [Oscillatoria amoena NRMC-F 0135]|nr:hypothetical protein [Oscillatoria amoena NRMC-F 0135]
MKKVFALLTIVSVMSFVACKNNTTVDHAADSKRAADSLQKIADSVKAAEEAAAAAQAADTNKGDSNAAAPEVK